MPKPLSCRITYWGRLRDSIERNQEGKGSWTIYDEHGPYSLPHTRMPDTQGVNG